MATLLEQFNEWFQRLPKTADVIKLRKIFDAQTRGHRLKAKDFEALEPLLGSIVQTNPLFISSHVEKSEGTAGRQLTRHSYSLSPYVAALKPDLSGRLNPRRHDFVATGEYQHVTGTTAKAMMRSFPISIRNEHLEYCFIRATGQVLNYNSPEMERLIALSLATAQYYETAMAGQPFTQEIPLYFEHQAGLIKAHLQLNEVPTLHHMAVYTKASVPVFKPVGTTELTYMVRLEDFKALNRLNRVEESLHQIMRDTFKGEHTARSLRELIDSYVHGATMPPMDHQWTPDFIDLQTRITAIIESPLWLQATHRSPYLKHALTNIPP